jgi:hypothetical protein
MNTDLVTTIDGLLLTLHDEREKGSESNRATAKAAIPLLWRARMAALAGAYAVADRLCNETADLIEQRTPRPQCSA